MSQYDPPYRSKSAQVRGRQSERRGAKLDGGKTVPMSGGGRQKGDYRTSRFLVENKETDNKSYSLRLDVLYKAEQEALRTPPGLLPQLRVVIQGEAFRLLREPDYLALGLGDLDAAE